MSQCLKYLDHLEENTIILKDYPSCHIVGFKIAKEIAQYFNLEEYTFKIK